MKIRPVDWLALSPIQKTNPIALRMLNTVMAGSNWRAQSQFSPSLHHAHTRGSGARPRSPNIMKTTIEQPGRE